MKRPPVPGRPDATTRTPKPPDLTGLDKGEFLTDLTGRTPWRCWGAAPGGAGRAKVSILLLRMLAERLRDADRKRIEFGTADILSRVAGRLVELAERFGEPAGDGIRITAPLTQEELAGWTGASREAVSRALRALRGRGWIQTARRSVVIRDLDALRRRAR